MHIIKKRHCCIFFLIMVMLYSCSAPYQVSTNVKLKYDWKLSDLAIEGDLAGTTVNAPIFEDATLPCLKDSKWSFDESGGGNYTITNPDTTACIKGMRKITWEVVTLKGKSHYLQFYRFNAPKGIPTDRFTLYVAEIVQLSKNTMVLKYSIKYHDVKGRIIMTFTR